MIKALVMLAAAVPFACYAWKWHYEHARLEQLARHRTQTRLTLLGLKVTCVGLGLRVAYLALTLAGYGYGDAGFTELAVYLGLGVMSMGWVWSDLPVIRGRIGRSFHRASKGIPMRNKVVGSVLIICGLLTACEPASAQLFRGRRERYSPCPDGNCSPSPSFPTVPAVAIDEVTPEELAAGVVVPPLDARPRNVSGQCVFMAGEPVLVTAGYEQFRGWARNAVQENWHGAWVDNFLAACQSVGIEMKSTKGGDWEIFKYAMAEGVPVYVQIAVKSPNDHAVCVCGVTATHVFVLDNNGPPVIKRWTRDKFASRWNGIAACPIKRKHGKGKPNTTPAPGQEVKPQPEQPQKPGQEKPVSPEPAKPAKECNCSADKVNEALVKLTEVATATNKTVGDLGGKVSTLADAVNKQGDRLTALEARPDLSVKLEAIASSQAMMQQEQTRQGAKLDDVAAKVNAIASIRVRLEPKK